MFKSVLIFVILNIVSISCHKHSRYGSYSGVSSYPSKQQNCFTRNSFRSSNQDDGSSNIGNINSYGCCSSFSLKSIKALSRLERSFDGKNNNKKYPNRGAVNSQLVRKGPASYIDGVSKPVDFLPSPRVVSNQIGNLAGEVPRDKTGITMAFVIWGQFIDHDLSITDFDKKQPFNIPIPGNDKFFRNQKYLKFTRSKFIPSTKPRQHANQLTAWIDGSQVYGISKSAADSLRTFSNGKLKTSNKGKLLPKNGKLFQAGDRRANQNILLTAYHTLFVLEHNRLCEGLMKVDKYLTDQEIYQAARLIVIGLIQKITLEDFVPILIGPSNYLRIVGKYNGYNPNVNPDLSTEFTTAAFRIGHPLLVDEYKFIDKNGRQARTLKLRQLFTNPKLVTPTAVGDIFRGLASNVMKQKNSQVISQVRNLLVQDERRLIREDLYSLNIQRGRDHGIPFYNDAKKAFNMRPTRSFASIIPGNDSINLEQKLKNLYGSPDNLQLWVGIIIEKSAGGVMGSLGSQIVGQTYRNLRDGDRFWYQGCYPREVINEIKSTSLTDIVRRNIEGPLNTANIFRLSSY